MAFETSAERGKTVTEADAAVVQFLKRTRSMVGEADNYLAALNTAKNDLSAAKAASDAAVAADDQNAVLANENAILAAKLVEADAVIVQATAIKASIEALV